MVSICGVVGQAWPVVEAVSCGAEREDTADGRLGGLASADTAAAAAGWRGTSAVALAYIPVSPASHSTAAAAFEAYSTAAGQAGAEAGRMMGRSPAVVCTEQAVMVAAGRQA